MSGVVFVKQKQDIIIQANIVPGFVQNVEV